VSPMEDVPLAEAVGLGCAQGGAGIEQAVADIDDPGGEGEEQEGSQGEMEVGGPGERERPDYGNGGGVEAGEVPEAQGARCVPGRGEGAARDEMGLRLRIDQGLRHLFHCRRDAGRAGLARPAWAKLSWWSVEECSLRG